MFKSINAGAERRRHEGAVTRGIERKTAKIPPDLFFWAAGASIAGSLALQATQRPSQANFVGQWAPTFLLLGLYNRLERRTR